MKVLSPTEYSAASTNIISKNMLSVMQDILAVVERLTPVASIIDVITAAEKNQYVRNKEINIDLALRLMVTGKIIVQCPMLNVYYLPLYGAKPILSAYRLIS